MPDVGQDSGEHHYIRTPIGATLPPIQPTPPKHSVDIFTELEEELSSFTRPKSAKGKIDAMREVAQAVQKQIKGAEIRVVGVDAEKANDVDIQQHVAKAEKSQQRDDAVSGSSSSAQASGIAPELADALQRRLASIEAAEQIQDNNTTVTSDRGS